MTEELKAQIVSVITRMEGWCSEDKALAMADLILTTRPRLVVEIGVFAGRSLVPQGMAMMEAKSGIVVGIDPWRKESATEGENAKANDEWWTRLDLNYFHQYTMEAIWKNKLESVVAVIRADSHFCHSMFGSIDILHVDGNHSELTSCRDLDLYLPKVKRGGYIWFDDTNWGTTQKAVLTLDQSCRHIRNVENCALFQKPDNNLV